MSYASSRAWALKETFRGFRQNFSLFSLATFLSALALSIPLFISTIFYELAEPIRQIPTSVEITVFTKSGTDMEKLSKAVAEIETIERVSLVPKDEAIRSLNEHLGLKDKAVKHNPLPDILIATVSSNTSPAGVDAAAGRIEKIEGVDMLAYETDWREKLDALSNAARLGLLCLGIVVLTLVMLVVAASIRLTTLSVQPQMKALYLFGASPSFAMRPIAWRLHPDDVGKPRRHCHHVRRPRSPRSPDSHRRPPLRGRAHACASSRRLVRWLRDHLQPDRLHHRPSFGSGRLAKGPPLTLFRETEHTFFSGLGAPIGATIQSFPNFRLRLTHK